MNAVVIGVGATLVMDGWALFLRRGFGVASLDFAMLGRWIGHLVRGRVYHERIGQSAPVAHERADRIGERGDLDAEVVDWEPSGALFSGPTGLEAIECLLAEAPAWLAPGGVFVCEIGATQTAALTGPGRVIRQDLAGRDRVLVARW